MDELTRHLINENEQMRRGLHAIAEGHQAGIDFLNWIEPDLPPITTLPDSLGQSLSLAEHIATAALEVKGMSQDTVNIGALRRMLLSYGQHQRCCTAGDVNSLCDCGWAAIYTKLIELDAPPVPADTVDGGTADILSPNG